MKLVTKVAAAFLVVGGLAAATVTANGAFAMVFFLLFFGSIAALATLFGGWARSRARKPALSPRRRSSPDGSMSVWENDPLRQDAIKSWDRFFDIHGRPRVEHFDATPGKYDSPGRYPGDVFDRMGDNDR